MLWPSMYIVQCTLSLRDNCSVQLNAFEIQFYFEFVQYIYQLFVCLFEEVESSRVPTSGSEPVNASIAHWCQPSLS